LVPKRFPLEIDVWVVKKKTMYQSIENYIKTRAGWIEECLKELMPAADEMPARLHEAMRYATLGGGKRLRPLLCMEVVEVLGGNPEMALKPALALEVFHGYTLVHDDLPCMDDDDLRRGRATCHRQYDEATAVLVGDALQALAFEWAASGPQAADCVLELARAGGSRGVVGGQMADMLAETTPPDAATLAYIHRHKTAALIVAAVRMGARCAQASQEQLAALTRYADAIGHAFQIADDVLDATASTDTLGKPAGSDDRNGKTTYVSLFGIEEARRQARLLYDEALKSIHLLPHGGGRLKDIATYLVDRSY